MNASSKKDLWFASNCQTGKDGSPCPRFERGDDPWCAALLIYDVVCHYGGNNRFLLLKAIFLPCNEHGAAPVNLYASQAAAHFGDRSRL